MAFLGLVIAGCGIVITRSKPPFIPIQASVQFLPADSKIPGQPVSLFERWVPMRWAWLWRLRDGIRGPLATVLVDAKIVDCTGLSEQMVSGLFSEPPLAETNGLRGWILGDPALKDLKRRLEQLGGRVIENPRVQTAHAIQSSLSMSRTVSASDAAVQLGLSLDLLPLIQPDGIDLMTIFKLTGVVTNQLPGVSHERTTTEPAETGVASTATHLATASRWHVPDGSGFFLLGPGASNGLQRLGVIVSTTIQRPRQ